MIFIFPYDVFFFICCLGMHTNVKGGGVQNQKKNPAKQILRKTSCIAIKQEKRFSGLKKKSHLSRMSWLLQTDSLMIFFPWFLSPNLQSSKEKNQQQVVNAHVISLTVSFSLICLFCFLFFRFIYKYIFFCGIDFSVWTTN